MSDLKIAQDHAEARPAATSRKQAAKKEWANGFAALGLTALIGTTALPSRLEAAFISTDHMTTASTEPVKQEMAQRPGIVVSFAGGKPTLKL